MEEKYVISKEDYKKYFKGKIYVSNEELILYNNKVNFNAIFNATPIKSYKKI